MIDQQRLEQAKYWFLLWHDFETLDEMQRQAFRLWASSRENKVAYLHIAERHALIEQRETTQRIPAPANSKIVVLSEYAGRRVRSEIVTPEVVPELAQAVTSRRWVVKSIAAGAVGLGIAAVTSMLETSGEDVIASGHVVKAQLQGGVMHAARNSEVRIAWHAAAQTVEVLAGQAAFDLWGSVRGATRVRTPLCEIATTAARFGVLVPPSMLVVSVAEGSVRIVSSGSGALDVVLAAGQKLTLRPDAAPAIALANAAREFGWVRKGDLYFEGESLNEAASTFNRFNQLQIVPSAMVGHLSVGSQRCALSNPQRFVDRVVARWGLASQRVGNVIHILRRNDGLRGF